ncbi:MAG: hypothetical protein AB8B50_15050 [Pirellulaceae bacterium]
MLISKRRFKWGFMLLLIAAAGVFVRPVRSWVDRALVMQIDRDLHVSQVHFHSKASVLEVAGIRWEKQLDGRKFGMRADRGVFAIEGEPLVDRSVIVPRGQLENVSLYFTSFTPLVQPATNPWEAELAAHQSQVDWDGIRKQFSTMLAPREVESEVRSQVDQAVRRSTEILAQAEGISSSYQWDNNPLRLTEEVRGKLQRVEELRSEQDGLLGKLASIQADVREKCQTLESELATRVNDTAQSLVTNATASESKRRIAEALMLDIARASWPQLMDCGELAHVIAMHHPLEDAGKFDSNIPIMEEGHRLLQIDELKAQGTFTHRRNKTPFQMEARLSYDESPTQTLQAEWRYGFNQGGDTVGVVATRDTRSDLLQIEAKVIESTIGETSPSDDGFAANSNDLLAAASGSAEDAIATLDVVASGEGLQGTMLLVARPVTGQTEEIKRVIARVLGEPSEQPMRFEVGVDGDWQSPTFFLMKSLPEALVNAVEDEVSKVLVEKNELADLELRQEFGSQVAALKERAALATEQAKRVLVDHRQRLVAARSSLQRSLAQLEGNTFTAGQERSLR